MRRILAAAVLVAFMPTANAQDKGKSDFMHNAEFRLRDTFEQNESGNTNTKPGHHNGIDQRFKLGLGFKANEKFSVNATLLQAAAWGQLSTETLGNRAGATGGDERNFMSVNEAYATWMMAEDFSMKFGRMNFAFGDGTIMSTNDYQPQPYAFDGVTAHYEAEFGRFQAVAFKYRDLSGPPPGNTNPGTTTSDAQHDAYGLIFDLKTMPEWLKMLNVNIIQDVADGVPGTTGSTVQTTQNSNSLRYGVAAGFNFSLVDLKANYEGVTGKNSDLSAGGVSSTDRKINANMYQAEVGLNFPALMGSRFYVNYHQDSGKKQSDTDNKAYDPYFYDRHNGSGMMELVGWGNLTDISVGWTGKPMDTTDVGLAYHMFSKTEKEDTVRAGYYGQNLFTGTACSPSGAAGSAACKSAIGSEIDAWAEHKYDGGLSMLLRLGYFMPGDTLKDSVVNKTASVTQVMVQGKLTF